MLCLPRSLVFFSSSLVLPRELLEAEIELLGEEAGVVPREPLDDRLLRESPRRPPRRVIVSITIPDPLPADALRGGADAACGDAAPSAAAGAAKAVAMAPAGSESEESVSLLRPNVAVESESMLVGFFCS